MYALALAAPAYAPAAKRAPITDYRPLTTESIAEACEWESSQARPDYRPLTTEPIAEAREWGSSQTRPDYRPPTTDHRLPTT